MGIGALLNTYESSSKIGVISGSLNIVVGVGDLWHLKTTSIPKQKDLNLPKANTKYNTIKPDTLPVKSNISPQIRTIVNRTITLGFGLILGCATYAVAKHYDDPCALAKMIISSTSFELLKSRKTAEKICQLCPSKILQKISSQKEDGDSTLCPMTRNNLEKSSIEVIHNSLKYTAALTQIAYGLYSLCSNIQPLKDAWNGMSIPERAHKRLGERYGNEILNFEDNSKGKILILHEQNTGGVLHIDSDSNFIKAFKAEHDLKVKVLAPGESAYKEICDALKTGNLKAVYHGVHANPFSIDTKNPTSDELDCIATYLPKQIQKPTYILNACKAGQFATSMHGTAVNVAKDTGMKVFANSRLSSYSDVFDINTNPVEVKFTTYRRPWIESTVSVEPCKTGYIVESPRTDDSYFQRMKRTFNFVIHFLRV